MNHFKALRVHQLEGNVRAAFEQLTLEDLTPGEVVVRVVYSDINYKDALAVTGKGKILRGSPRVPGVDLSGYVVSSTVPEFKEGDSVFVTGCDVGEGLDGGYAQFARVPAAAVVPVPDGLSLFEVMALGTAGFTAAFALRRMLENHQSPEMGPIAISGATGGVGSIALNVFKRAGFELAAITGKSATAEVYLRSVGADQVIDRSSLSLNKGPPLEKGIWGGAVDNLGGATLSYLLRTVRTWGTITSIGLAQDPALVTTVMPFILRGVSLIGIHSVHCPRPWRLEIWGRLASDWKPNALSVIAPRRVKLEDLPGVCDELIAGTVTGRTVVEISREDGGR